MAGTRTEQLQKLWEMIREIRVAMLTTVEPSGELRSRPMATQEVQFDGDLYFFTQEHSPKVGEIKQDHDVCVTYSDNRHERWISVTGTASVITDHETIARYWNPTLQVWFPKGMNDPELALLKVSVREAEFWEAPPTKASQLVGMLGAAISGKEYDAGDHGKFELR